jgi:hypothetical protein
MDGNIVIGAYEAEKSKTLRREVKIIKNGYEIRDYCTEGLPAISQFIVPSAERTLDGVLIKSFKGKPAIVLENNGDTSFLDIKLIKVSRRYGQKTDSMAVRFMVKESLRTTLRLLDS